MSLTSLNIASAANEGRVMPVLHPDDRTPLKGPDGNPVTITLMGQDSDAFIRSERTARNKMVDNMAKQVKFSAAASDQQAAETLAACTLDWSGIPAGWIDGSDDETPAEFSRDAAKALYASPGLRWLKAQVDEFVAERRNFLKA